jgi:HAD superfamily hydrolase (TIGR01549 family)
MTEPICRAWLLDFDGTLYRAAPVKWLMALELVLCGLPQLGKLRKFRHEHERVRLELTSSVPDPFALQLERAASALGIEVAVLQAVVQAWMFERPQKWIRRWARHDLIEQARQFHAQGGKLAVVSDYPVSQKLRALQPALPLQAIVASGEQGGPGLLKPNPDGYLEAARLLGVPPEQCLVIGDRLDADGEAAARAGMAFRLV